MPLKLFFSCLGLALIVGCTQQPATYTLTLPDTSPRSEARFGFGSFTNPRGSTVLVDSKGIVIDGQPVIPVMGEIHYSRVPQADWERELMKMKSGGITVAATYIFWNHHEAREGEFDWSGNRNLRAFIRTCGKVGLDVVIRVGPFCHGEVYLGGFPEWIVDKAKADPKHFALRSEAPGFLAAVTRLYGEIFDQISGLQWKDGGPVIGMQLENEYGGRWSYMTALKRIALDAGFDLPFYTRTGWPKMKDSAEFGQILPLYGDYADGFWDRELTDMPGAYSEAFTFKSSRLSAVIASETFGLQNTDMAAGDLAYPYLTCELGGGMMTSYHRRIHIFDRDALALLICKLGSGSNLPGYYMYHGGTNPYCADHPMSEFQASKTTNYNDLPVMTYDFQAPLGEMGQVNGSYHLLRRIHLMLAEWGGLLSGYDPVWPQTQGGLRWTVRTDGHRGWVFINNYERMKSLGVKKDVRFALTLADGSRMDFPRKSFEIPEGASFCFPFNLQFGDVNIDYAIAQPICSQGDTIYFAGIEGIRPEISVGGKVHRVKAGRSFSTGKATFIVLDEKQARNMYKIDGKVVFADGIPVDGGIERWTSGAKVDAVQTAEAGKPREAVIGAAGAATEPWESDFDKAAAWSIPLPEALGDADFLKIDYRGDVARVYADGRLVEDNFWNGRPMLVRCSDLAGKKVELKILPLLASYPIYLQKEQKEVLDAAGGSLLSLDGITVLSRTNQ